MSIKQYIADKLFNFLCENSPQFRLEVKMQNLTENDVIRIVNTAHEDGQIAMPWDDAWEDMLAIRVSQIDGIVFEDTLADKVYDEVKFLLEDVKVRITL